MTLAALDRVKLTVQSAATFPDLADCTGVVLRVETGWAVIKWRGVEGETRLPENNLTTTRQP